jgi:hypothetical protein
MGPCGAARRTCRCCGGGAVLGAAGSPQSRPLRLLSRAAIAARFAQALETHDGDSGAHCIHELWMRGEFAANIEAALERLWRSAAPSIPHWLPMRYVEWLPAAYEITGQFQVAQNGRSNIYLVLLDYSDRVAAPFGVYVGMSRYSPAQRFDQHKAGIRASGSVLKRGLEVLAGPTLHLQNIKRSAAVRIEEELAYALRAAGLTVRGGH